MEDTNEDEKRVKKITDNFDEQIIKEYLAEFRNTQWSKDGQRTTGDRIWSDLVNTLGITGTNVKRYIEGLGKDMKRPVSPYDGQPERKDRLSIRLSATLRPAITKSITSPGDD